MTERGTDQRKGGSEVKIFPVPINSGEIKQDISITSNLPTKLSKEKIINQAIKFHREGNIPEAEKYYEEALSLPLFPELLISDQMFVIETLKKLTLD